MSSEPGVCAVIVEERGQAVPDLLAAALDRARLWDHLAAAQRASGLESTQFRILIAPDLHAFEIGSPAACDPALVEFLIDRLHDRGYVRVDVAASTDSAYFWAENRSVVVLADLLGYRYATPGGHDYEVLDLSEDLVAGEFGSTGVLRDSAIARVWRDANFRIAFARNKTDEREGYALTLAGALNVLPLADKDYHYRSRLDAGEVVAELLQRFPLHFAVIDASVSAHGNGAARAPSAIETGCVIASENALLADFAAALKMGLDPHVSALAATVFRRLGLPRAYEMQGNLAVYPGWRNVEPLLRESFRRRDASPALSRLVTPWLQSLNRELFPLKQLLDAQLNPRLSRFFGRPDEQPSVRALLAAVNYAIGALESGVHAYRVLFDKDAIRRVDVPLGFDPARYTDADYAAIRPELDLLQPLLDGIAPVSPGLHWREVAGATVFEFERDLPIAFELFSARVDVARTIQFMNDYIGGVVVPLRHDERGRVLLQAERNVYLPQPNYLVLYQGQPIDVSKIECCHYEPDRHRMYWKTIASENASAVHDDGVVSFSRSARGTLVRIVGRQLFVLPPFWQAVDLDLLPELKSALVTHAYKTFFERTCANFEALVEGRDIRIGVPWHQPAHPFDTEQWPAQALERLGKRLVQHLEARAGEPLDGAAERYAGHVPDRVDEDGFRHFSAPAQHAPIAASSALTGELQRLADALSEFFAGYSAAVMRDLRQMPQAAAKPPP